MSRAQFRFYAELNDFLPSERRHHCFDYEFTGEQTVKHLVESIGVPHTEVDLILADGRSVDFSHRVRDEERISVYPMFETFDISRVSRVRPQPLRHTRFILDMHLGRLAAYLRMLGFDSRYDANAGDQELAEIAAAEHRIILTKDRGLLKRRNVTHGYCVRHSNAREQVVEVLRRFDLARSVSPFERCLCCNEKLERVAKEQVLDRIPPRCRIRHEEFWRCRGCGRIYWPGSHHRRMRRFIQESVEQALHLLPPPHWPGEADESS